MGGKADGGQERLGWVAHILQSEVAEIPLPVTWYPIYFILYFHLPFMEACYPLTLNNPEKIILGNPAMAIRRKGATISASLINFTPTPIVKNITNNLLQIMNKLYWKN